MKDWVVVEGHETRGGVSLYTRLEIFCSISATKSVPVSTVLFFEIPRGHIASSPRAKIGQALSPCERELALINNVLTSETKSAKKELFIGTLHALSSNILRLASLCFKEFLAGFLREKSGWSKLWKRFYICCLVPISQKRKRGKHEEGIYPLFWCFSCLSLELTQMLFFFTKNTIFRSIRFTSRLLMDELTGFGWLARSTPPLRGYPILSKAISTSWIVKTKC